MGIADRDYMRRPPSDNQAGSGSKGTAEERLAKLWKFVVILGVVAGILIVITVITVTLTDAG